MIWKMTDEEFLALTLGEKLNETARRVGIMRDEIVRLRMVISVTADNLRLEGMKNTADFLMGQLTEEPK